MAASVDARMVAWVDGESINAGGLRLGQAASSMGGATALSSRGGVRPSGGEPGLIAALPTPGMKVRVTAGIFVLPSASPTGGEYRIALETQTDLDIDNSGSFPRTDLVIAEVVDTGTSAATATVRVLKGPTNSPGAARPTNTTPNAHYIVLGSVDVRVGAESGGNIRAQDVHPERQWAVAAGGIVPVADQTQRDALPKWLGLYADRADTGSLERCNGTDWGIVAGQLPMITNYRGGSFAAWPAGQWSNVPIETSFGEQTFNPAGEYFEDLMATEYRIRVKKAGLYRLTYAFSTSVANVVGRIVSRPTAGAAGVPDRVIAQSSASGAAIGQGTVTRDWRLLAGAYVGASLYFPVGGADTADSSAAPNGNPHQFTIVRLGD